ncbi:MAG: ABC transporter ATP-binding protein/permease [Roseburia sp.]|nr:ABC transporter ATP-binding protein/permease [Roseburia sp.]MCM1098336.1 ABC transporter ATP-binding protein/permease [Ruminococcus flavefaciens]
MKLLYTLKESQQKALSLRGGEEIWYCVPVDLGFDNEKKRAESSYTDTVWIVVTTERLLILEGERKAAEYELRDCEKIKCEHQVYSGIVTVFGKDGSESCAARFSMRHIIRVAYAVRGAQTILNALETGCPLTGEDRVESREYEKYCEKCGRALPGTSKCPYCEGKADVLKKLMALCGEFVGKLLLISLLMVLVSAINLISPMVQRNFIDQSLASGQGTVTELWRFIGITFFLMVAGVVLGIFRYWNCVKLGASISMSLRRKLYYKIQILSLSFINNRRPGELMNRVSRDTRRIREFMEEVFGDMFSTLLTMIVSLVMMLIISWKMTLLSLVFIIVVFVITRLFWHQIHTIFHKQWLRFDDMHSSLQDIISGMRIVKSFGQEARESARFTEKTQEFAAVQKKNETFWAIFFPILTFLLGVGTYIAVFFGGIQVLDGEMTVGQLVQFVTYSGYLYGPLSWMTHLPRSVMQMVTSLNRIYDVLDEEPMLADKEDSKVFPIRGAFTFEDVSFGYQTYEPVLENVSFSVKQGEMIGLVGASGTGKSTLINLIMRLYDVDQGRITLDGYDLRDIQMESLHSQIGVVLQETFLFSGSILANIRFAKQDATLEEVIRAARAANAHDFICKTPDGYNTYVGEHGYNLSGGERQRIAIARAILNNPRILILDEATSALDTESEFLIQQALDRLIQGRTTFAIAHRLSTLRNADRLVVIDRHGIAEIGTHNELLEKKGIYYGLVNAQLKMSETGA